VDIVITGRHTEISDRFRGQAAEKLEKISQLCPSAYRIDVEVSHERNPRQAATCKKVEITVNDKGPVIRAEAVSDEPYSALDIAFGKLLERLRRSRDRRKVHHGRHTPASVRRGADAIPGSLAPPSLVDETAAAQSAEETEGESPLVIRAKDHDAVPMTVDQALYEMELVGHDFFLFLDSDSGLPSVVYRRRGWNYGVIRLRAEGSAPPARDRQETADREDAAAATERSDAPGDGSAAQPFDARAVLQNGSSNGVAHSHLAQGLVPARG
jgi:ribosomal subunit interface protein